METRINYSHYESEILNLKVGRCVTEQLDINSFNKQLTEEAYDLIRLTVASDDEFIIDKLYSAGIPYFFAAGITRYKTAIERIPVAPYINEGIEFVEFDGTQTQLLYDMIKATLGNYPIGYFRTPILKEIISKEMEIEVLYEFYKFNNLKTNNINNSMMFIKHQENFVGYFALNILPDRLESHIGGIREPFRTNGYFVDMQEFIKRYCIQNQLTYFCFGARNENSRAQHIFQKYGYQRESMEYVFHLPLFLSTKK
ncbi:MAG TPA: hypothetical protein PKO18_04920 [Chitinophagales bacterium]|nr:hypothetical protein [Chitinophagales bacterium]HNL84562.1 hypothetical protein [Chitinophagales bacterium]